METNEKFSTFLHKKIREFHNNILYNIKNKGKEAVQPINIIVSDDNIYWIGCLNADVYWVWVEINDFWFWEARGNTRQSGKQDD